MLFTYLLRVRDVFNIDFFLLLLFFFYFHILFATVLLIFRFRNFVLCVGSRQTKNIFDLLSYFFVFFFRLLFFFFCQFCMNVAVAFPLGNSFIILFSVAIYSHANECSVRFTVFESTVICCEFFFFFFVESCLFSVELSCVCSHMFYNLQCRGRAVTNVVRTCGPTQLLYYKEQ